jgi:hypothetical protein
MRERVSVLEVEEMQYKVCISNEAGSGEPNPGFRPKILVSVESALVQESDLYLGSS